MADHQRRIQDELARKKTEAMNNYLDALADDEPDVSLLLLRNTSPLVLLLEVLQLMQIISFRLILQMLKHSFVLLK